MKTHIKFLAGFFKNQTTRLGRFYVPLCFCVLCLVFLYQRNTTAANNCRVPVSKVFDESRPAASAYNASFTNKSVVTLVICVLSKPSNREKRRAIRQTWASKLPKDIKFFFVVGTAYLPYVTKTLITVEQKLHMDLLLLSNLNDSYKQLTLKVLDALRWAHENTIFDYFLKVDDDTFVRVDEFRDRLQQRPRERLYWGFFNNRSVIVRVGKWAEPKPYICDRYVSYALGGGYVLSKDLVAYVVDNADKFKKFANEDVSVGTWLAPLDIKAVHDESFRMSGECKEDQIVLHHSSIDDMKRFYQSLTANNSLCGKTQTNFRKPNSDASDTNKPIAF